MKLLNLSSRYFFLAFLVLMLLMGALLFFSINSIVSDELDEYLENRVEQLREAYITGNYSEENISRSFRIVKISKKEAEKFQREYPKGKFSNSLWVNFKEKEKEPLRILEKVFFYKGDYFKLKLFVTLINRSELLQAILWEIVFVVLVLLLLTFLINRLILARIWSPFYKNLRELHKFRLDRDHDICFAPSSVLEFEELRSALDFLIRNNRKVYLSQKEFIENASHEIQTPLAIVNNKLTQLMQKPDLDEKEAKVLIEIEENLERLTRLNQSLLLLNKIEHQQYVECEKVVLSDVLLKNGKTFKEIAEHQDLKFTMTISSETVISMNPDLAEVLINNLLTNAIKHNIDSGFIVIELSGRGLVVSNSGKPLDLPIEEVFTRFSKRRSSRESNGLGLHIVKSICDLYKFALSYECEGNLHRIRMQF